MKKNILLGSIAAALLACFAFSGCSNDVQPANSNPVASQQDPSSSVSSSAVSFDDYFSENPIDSAHEDAQLQALSTMEMLDVETRFADVWKIECEQAYEKLLDAAPSDQQAAIEQAQQQWSSQLPTRLNNIASQVQGSDGTMAGVQGAIDTLTLYRDHAKELYSKLYQYDHSFSFSYQPD